MRCVGRRAPPAGVPLQSLRDLDAQLRQHGGRWSCGGGPPEKRRSRRRPGRRRDQRAHQHRLRALRRARQAGGRGAGRGPAQPHRFCLRGGPGCIVKSDGQPFRVFTPFYRTWSAHGWPAPAESDPARISWRRGISGAGVPQDPKLPARLVLPDAGEQAAYYRKLRGRQSNGHATDR